MEEKEIKKEIKRMLKNNAILGWNNLEELIYAFKEDEKTERLIIKLQNRLFRKYIKKAKMNSNNKII